MRNVLLVVGLFFAASCSSGDNSKASYDSIGTKGNSPGSNIIEMDTLHMDTTSQHIIKENTH